MKIITVCGSGKNRALIHSVCDALQKRKFIVLPPPLHNIERYNNSIDSEGCLLLWKGATFAHLNRIKTSDVCIMINPEGYLGIGSSIELGYAVSLGKFVVALQHDSELAREALFDMVLETEECDEIVNQIELMLRG